jgi:hypothetical protein
MQWASLIGNLMGQGNEQLLQKQGQNQKQQQIDMEKQQQLRQQQDSDRMLAEHMNSIGAKPVIAGTVKDTQTIPETPGVFGGGQTITLARPVDSTRVVKHKSAEGDSVQWELPTAEEQAQRQVQLKQPQVAADVAEAGQKAQATSTGQAAGVTAGKQADLLARGIPVTKDMAAGWQQPGMEGTTILPEERDTLNRYLGSAGIRADASRDVAGTRADAARDVAGQRTATQAQLQQDKQDWMDQQNARKLGFQDSWAKARVAVAGSTQNALNSRAQLRSFDAAQTNWGKTQDAADKEAQKILDSKALLDPTATPDQTQFTHPWTGTKQTMNAGWRQQIQTAAARSTERVNRLNQQAQDIAGRYSIAPTPADAAAAPARPPGPATAPKVTTRAEVQAYATKKRIDVNRAIQEYQAAGFTVK